MMDDDYLADSCVASLVSFSYSKEPVSAVTAKRVLTNKPSLRSLRYVRPLLYMITVASNGTHEQQ